MCKSLPDGLYKSSDGGGNWVLLTNGLPAAPATNVVVVPLSPSTIYAIVGNGVFKSADGGATWGAAAQTADVPSWRSIRDVKGIVYAGGPAVPANLIKSTDGGLHWTPVAIVDMDAQSPGATVVTTISRMVQGLARGRQARTATARARTGSQRRGTAKQRTPDTTQSDGANRLSPFARRSHPQSRGSRRAVPARSSPSGFPRRKARHSTKGKPHSKGDCRSRFTGAPALA